jgi:ubiquitin C-terminal hydrolase
MNYKFEKYKDNGLSGLTNLGNTCFLNSIMQALSHTYELNIFLDKKTYKLNKKYDSMLLISWDELRTQLWQTNNTVSPLKFVNTVQQISKIKDQTNFMKYNQNDTSEFLIFIIDCFHNALSREVRMTIQGNIKDDKDKIAVKCYELIKNIYEKDYSEIWDLFYGIHISQLENTENGNIISIVPEPFFLINLPIPTNNNNPSLYDCFDLYVEQELVDGVVLENTTEKISVKKNIMFWSLPNILVIDIKRYNEKNKKNEMMIDFPLERLNLSKYVVGYNKDAYIYDLYAICNHNGCHLQGHYTCFVKNANSKWYFYNDNNVFEVKPEQILTSNAYCFFYRKQIIL